jgi:hypothetical protein
VVDIGEPLRLVCWEILCEISEKKERKNPKYIYIKKNSFSFQMAILRFQNKNLTNSKKKKKKKSEKIKACNTQRKKWKYEISHWDYLFSFFFLDFLLLGA